MRVTPVYKKCHWEKTLHISTYIVGDGRSAVTHTTHYKQKAPPRDEGEPKLCNQLKRLLIRP